MFKLDVPKDIRKVEAKVIGPLTLRQIVWGCIGGAASYLAVFVQKSVLGPDVPISTGFVFLFAAIPGIIGFIPIQNMPAEKFFKYFFMFYLRPRKAKYKVNSYLKKEIKDLADQYEKEEEKLIEGKMKADRHFRKAELSRRKNIRKAIRAEAKEYDAKFDPME